MYNNFKHQVAITFPAIPSNNGFIKANEFTDVPYFLLCIGVLVILTRAILRAKIDAIKYPHLLSKE